MTAILLISAALSQQAFVRRDRRPRRLPPAELARAIDSRLPRPLRQRREPRRGATERIRVPVVDTLACAVDDLGQARVAIGRDGAAARKSLEARQAEPFVAARKHEAAGCGVDVDQLGI